MVGEGGGIMKVRMDLGSLVGVVNELLDLKVVSSETLEIRVLMRGSFSLAQFSRVKKGTMLFCLLFF